MRGYTVIVDDNFHYMDESEQYELGTFDSCEAAIIACKQVVDDFLLSSVEPAMSEEELWRLFTGFGDTPIIIPGGAMCPFSAWGYARERCRELTLGAGS